MTTEKILLLSTAIFFIAMLYSSVGHAGASGYIAIMALFGLAPTIMKPTSLILNIIVAIIATIQFYRARCFVWSIFWPFVIGSIPLAFLGGRVTLPHQTYELVIGIVLLYSAYRLFKIPAQNLVETNRAVPTTGAVFSGGCIGFISGLTGIGGGVFLSPILLFSGWATIRQTAGIAAPFILVNSIAGLCGQYSISAVSENILQLGAPLAIAAVIGGIIGSTYGSKHASHFGIRRILTIVLIIASAKLLFSFGNSAYAMILTHMQNTPK